MEEVDIVPATPNFAAVRFPSGKQSTVSLKDIAPAGSSLENISGNIKSPSQIVEDVILPEPASADPPDADDAAAEPTNSDSDRIIFYGDIQTQTVTKKTEKNVQLHRSTRLRKPV